MATMKALRKDEDLANVPLSEPVLIDLNPEWQEVETEAEAKPAPKAKERDEDAGVNVLKEQLAALQEANRLTEERRLAAERRAENAERERDTAVTSQSRTEEDALQSGLAAAQAELETAKQQAKQAGDAGDWGAQAEALAKVGRASADIREFERAAATLADRKETGRVEQRQTTQATTDVNAMIDGNPQLLPAERTWLKSHPEAIMDISRNKELDVAYIKATRQGISRGTPDYFKFIEQEMGYTKTQAKEEDDDEMGVSAPVSRNERGSDGKPSNGKVMLTAEQRELAKNMGITEIEYARGVQELDRRRREDPEKYR